MLSKNDIFSVYVQNLTMRNCVEKNILMVYCFHRDLKRVVRMDSIISHDATGEKQLSSKKDNQIKRGGCPFKCEP